MGLTGKDSGTGGRGYRASGNGHCGRNAKAGSGGNEPKPCDGSEGNCGGSVGDDTIGKPVGVGCWGSGRGNWLSLSFMVDSTGVGTGVDFPCLSSESDGLGVLGGELELSSS